MKGDFLLVTSNNCHGIALESVKTAMVFLLELVNGVLSSPMTTAMVFYCALSSPNGVFLVVMFFVLLFCCLLLMCVCFVGKLWGLFKKNKK